MQTYMGELTVEPNEFRLRAERMIIRQRRIILDDDIPKTIREISYDLLYTVDLDSPEEHRLSGIAHRQREGHYEDSATFYILRAKINEDDCFFEGFWIVKNEGVWKFSGNLAPLTEVA